MNLFYEIEKYLKEYEINDQEYIYSCQQALQQIIDKNLIHKFEKIHNQLFIEEKTYLNYWKYKDINDLFACDVHPYTTNLLLILGLKYHEMNMKKYHYDEQQIKLHHKRIYQTLTYDIYVQHLQGIRLSQLIWATYFIHADIIECGILQYEIADKIYMHIPKNTILTNENIQTSLKKAKYDLERYYHIKDQEFACMSWMLSLEVLSVLPDSSNIKVFSQYFDIQKGNECHEDILNFVFGNKNLKINERCENTSLQRKIKYKLLNNEKFYYGIGILKRFE